MKKPVLSAAKVVLGTDMPPNGLWYILPSGRRLQGTPILSKNLTSTGARLTRSSTAS